MAYKRKYASRGTRSAPYTRRSYPRRVRSYGRSTVPRQRITGRGDYKTWWNRTKSRWFRPYTGKLAGVGGAIGSAAGNVIAPGIGGTIGGGLGGLAGMAVDRIMGWGDYNIIRNSIAIPSQAASVPVFGKGSIRVTHKEYIGSVEATSIFSRASLPLNPGMPAAWPWLAQIAANFSQYRLNGCVFQFISTSGDALNSTDTALGKVIMATDYNPTDETFVSVQQMMGTEFSNSGKPSENIMHAIECAPQETAQHLYWIRTGPPASNSDLRLSDMGNFQIATLGMQGTNVIGDLWVSYDVTLCKPVQDNVLGYTLPVAHYRCTGVSTTDPFGSARVLKAGSNLELTVGDDSIVFPPDDEIGTYLIQYNVQGTVAATNAVPTISYTNCSGHALFNNATVTNSSNASVSDDTFILSTGVQLDERGANIIFSGGTLPTGTVNADLWIIKIPYDIEG